MISAKVRNEAEKLNLINGKKFENSYLLKESTEVLILNKPVPVGVHQ